MSREYTCKVLDLMDEGVVDPKWLAEVLLNYLSEDDVEDFAIRNELVEEIFEDEDDGQPDEAQEWESFDHDC